MASKKLPSLTPINPIVYVSSKRVVTLPPDSLSSSIIGEKALGLACIPKAWTLPFIVITGDLVENYKLCDRENKSELLRLWIRSIVQAAKSVGLKDEDFIIVRSSACSEGLKERGEYFSERGSLRYIYTPLEKCMRSILKNVDFSSGCMPLVVQKYANPVSFKGHLSNELRCSKDIRDWMAEIEPVASKVSSPFKITLRNRPRIDKEIDSSLSCNLSPHISKILKTPAAWATEKKCRIHFEWVWDGHNIYIVQADHERKSQGVDPNKVVGEIKYLSNFKPKCLVEISNTHAERFTKIRNVFTYMKLKIPSTNLYVLDDQALIRDLASGKIAPGLKHDIEKLVEYSLVIRMDITSLDLNSRQMLPRTNEVRKLNDALEWLKDQSKLIEKLEGDVAFIFHNFIPSVSSAFAYAAPDNRKVQIEALWGLPEGLYYNSHDKYVVDTLRANITEISEDPKTYKVHASPNFKGYFITPDEHGQWRTQLIKEQYGWSETIGNKDLVAKIALESRKIAEEEGTAISVMWFVGVPEGISPWKVIPWHHEHFDASRSSRAKAYRTKTQFDRSLIISTSKDIEGLQGETEKAQSNVRRIKIQPQEDKLLRDKETLKVIGGLAKKINAMILLEGGVLSHAYYQLLQTGATVEILHPFQDMEDKREFNKLVRDKIPENIKQGGELVSTASLEGENLLRALREKLVEEATEVLDASDEESIIGELADVREVIDGIISILDIKSSHISKKQIEKRKKAGGFKTGSVLFETKNPLPTMKQVDPIDNLFPSIEDSDEQSKPPIDGREIIQLGHKLSTWKDKREHETSTEVLLRVSVPIARDDWTINTQRVKDRMGSGNIIYAKLTGKRVGSKYEIELSAFSEYKQLDLFKLL